MHMTVHSYEADKALILSLCQPIQREKTVQTQTARQCQTRITRKFDQIVWRLPSGDYGSRVVAVSSAVSRPSLSQLHTFHRNQHVDTRA